VSVYLPEELRTRIIETDRNRCAYCQTSEDNSGIPLTIDHIQPQSKGGKTEFENLCQACWTCNEFKAALTEAVDPLTGETAALFNPRLQINRPVIVAARGRWVSGGWHPPAE